MEGRAHLRLVRQIYVALEAERCRVGERLAIVRHIPDAGSAVLGGTGLGRVNEELLRRAVRANQRRKVGGGEPLRLELRVKGVAGAGLRWQEARR